MSDALAIRPVDPVAPPADLTPTIDQLVEDFSALRINHPKLARLEEVLTATLRDSPKNSIIFITGPGGVGKTTLREKIEHAIQLRLAGILTVDRVRIPLASLEALTPESGNFNWPEQNRRLLECLCEPLIDLRKDRLGVRIAPHMLVASGHNARTSGAAYQTSVEKAILQHGPEAIFIDEAQNLMKTGSGKRLIDNLDIIKSMANRTMTRHILVGTYDLLRLRNLNGQLCRRSIDLPFERYQANDLVDAKDFRNVVRNFANRMPFTLPPDLVHDWEYLYQGSLGCVGILKDWLTRALSSALRRGATTIERIDLKASEMTVAKLNKLLTECIEGERCLKETEDDRRQLRIRMGLDRPPKEPKADAEVLGLRLKNQKPGNRNPKRDKVGRETATVVN